MGERGGAERGEGGIGGARSSSGGALLLVAASGGEGIGGNGEGEVAGAVSPKVGGSEEEKNGEAKETGAESGDRGTLLLGTAGSNGEEGKHGGGEEVSWARASPTVGGKEGEESEEDEGVGFARPSSGNEGERGRTLEAGLVEETAMTRMGKESNPPTGPMQSSVERGVDGEDSRGPLGGGAAGGAATIPPKPY